MTKLDGLAGSLFLLGVVLTAVKDVPAPSWLHWILLGSGSTVLVLSAALKWVRGQSTVEGQRRELLRQWPPPSVTEVDPFRTGLGIFSSAIAEKYVAEGETPPYVKRDVDDALDLALRKRGLVLVSGAAKAGKSRTAFESLYRMRSPPRLLIPSSTDDLPAVLGLNPPLRLPGRAHALWLDELDRYVTNSRLNAALLLRFTERSHAVVIATITHDELDRLSSEKGDIGWRTREILELLSEVTLPDTLSQGERAEARRLYTAENIDAAIGAHFAAARELVQRFRTAATTMPQGFAVVAAALDWRRAGAQRPISDEELRAIYPTYLKRIDERALTSHASYEEGLEWANARLESRASLITPVSRDGKNGYDIFDYIREWADSGATDVDQQLLGGIPASTWSYVIRYAGQREQFSVGLAAHSRGAFGAAARAWRNAAEPAAWAHLGVLLAEDQRPRGAERAYKRAITSADGEWAPAAAVNLGALLIKQGEMAGASIWLQRAVDSGHAEHAVRASVLLGAALKRDGHADMAVRSFQPAIESGHADYAPKATILLGEALEELGRDDEAIRAYQACIASRHPKYAPEAAIRLGDVLAKQSKTVDAARAYQRAIDFGHVDHTSAAARSLGELYLRAGQRRMGIEALESAMKSGHPLHAPGAALSLAFSIIIGRGRTRTMLRALQQALDSGQPDDAATAGILLGRFLMGQKRFDKAVPVLRRVMETGHRDYSPEAAFKLGNILRDEGLPGEAARAYRRAIESDHWLYPRDAAVALGDLLKAQGFQDEATDAYQQAVDHGSSKALVILGKHLEDLGRHNESAELFRKAVESADSECVPEAAVRLGMLSMEANREQEAVDFFLRAIRAARGNWQSGSNYAQSSAAVRALTLLGHGEEALRALGGSVDSS